MSDPLFDIDGVQGKISWQIEWDDGMVSRSAPKQYIFELTKSENVGDHAAYEIRMAVDRHRNVPLDWVNDWPKKRDYRHICPQCHKAFTPPS